MKKKFGTAAFAAAPVALALALAGCTTTTAGDGSGMPGMGHGGGSPASPSAMIQGDFNAADSMFAMMMIPHHEQAIEMSDIILAKNGVDQRSSISHSRSKMRRARRSSSWRAGSTTGACRPPAG